MQTTVTGAERHFEQGAQIISHCKCFYIFNSQNLIFMHNYVNSLLQDAFRDQFLLYESVATCSARNQDVFCLENSRLTAYRSNLF